MPRLFTALELPDDVARELALLRGGLSGARWIAIEDYHITLRFFGDVDRPTAREIVSMLGEIRSRPFDVTLDGLGAFGSHKPRAIIAKVQPGSALLDLQQEHEGLARRLGLAPETRHYAPHVTLARLRGASGIAVAAYLGECGFLTRRFAVTRAVLFSSRDSVGGGPYMAEEAYPFG